MWPVKSARKCKFFIWNRQNQDYCLFDKHEYELSYKTMGGPTFPDVRTCCWIDHGIENYQVMFYQHLLYATDFAKHMSLVGCHNLNKIELNWECIFERQLALLVALQGESIWKVDHYTEQLEDSSQLIRRQKSLPRVSHDLQFIQAKTE